MPLFGKKHLQKEVAPDTKAEKKVSKAAKPAKEAKAPKAAKAPQAEKKADKKAAPVIAKSSVLKKPRITEKAAKLAEQGVYAFDVAVTATEGMIAKAVEEAYKVVPVRISVLKVPGKSVTVRGRIGSVSAGKKAYVYLKKGDKIDLI